MASPEDVARDVAEELGERFEDIDVRETFLTWVQEGIDEIITSGRFLQVNAQESITLVNGTRDYTLDNTVSEVITFRLLDSAGQDIGEAIFAAREALIRRGKDLSGVTTGTPEHWFYSGVDSLGSLQISFFPTPDAATAVTAVGEVLAQPPVPSATAQIPFPREFIMVLKEIVRFKAYRNGGETELAQASFTLYNQQLQILVARFIGPFRGGSSLPVKTRMKTIDQGPAAADGG